MRRFLAALSAGMMLSLLLASTAVSAATAGANPGGLPMLRDHLSGKSHEPYPTVSLNWSGYAVTPTSASKKFTYVTSTFVQPAITCPGGIGAAGLGTSEWVGLDGFDNQTVEQDGTQAYCGGSGYTTPEYVAWYEMYPAGSVNVFHINAGDTITASVSYKSNKFTLTVSDLTSNLSKSKTAPCSSCERTSAEWINERYADCNNGETKCWLIALGDFGTAKMTDNLASEGGANMPITAFPFGNSFPMIMVYNLNGKENGGSQGFESLVNTTPVTKSDTFKVVWQRSGGITPIQL